MTMKKMDSTTNPREMFDELPEDVFYSLKRLGKEIYDIIEKYYDPHTCVTIGYDGLTVKRDVLNTYV